MTTLDLGSHSLRDVLKTKTAVSLNPGSVAGTPTFPAVYITLSFGWSHFQDIHSYADALNAIPNTSISRQNYAMMQSRR